MKNSPRFFAVILILLLLLPPLFINQQQQQQEKNDYFGMINDYLNTGGSPSSEMMEWLQSILLEENFLPDYLEQNEEENYATITAGWDSLELPAQDEEPAELSDSFETDFFRTDLLNLDSDNDGCTDELEVQLGFDPHAPDEPLFTLTAITESAYRPDYLYALQDELAKFGIALDIEILDWGSFVNELLGPRNFDLFYIGFLGGGDPGPGIHTFYHSNGSLNPFMLQDSLNDWYIDQGQIMMPPDSEERIQHYWNWEQYLMDKILPLVPVFTLPNYYAAYWSTLAGYNHSDGLLQSWGKMEWTAAHSGQDSTDELVIASYEDWINLNPLFGEDPTSLIISNAIMDPLIWFDADMRAWPHLATSWTHINATHVRLSLREDVQWQLDPDGLFPNEEFDAEDVYFSFYCLTDGFGEHQELCTRWESYDCFKDAEIIDKYTIDVYIDGNSSTPENEPYAPYLDMLNTFRVLPEHYLNQSQLADGKTPDISHPSWNTFASHCFGTGILAFDAYTAGVETNLTRFNDCWWMNSSITSDPALDWQNRFGDKWALEQLRIMIIDFIDVCTEFELLGHLDLIDVNQIKREEYRADPNFEVQGKLGSAFVFFGFNLQESRGTPLQSTAPCPGDSSMRIGLAVRKAIAHAADREGMNEDINGGEYNITDYPLPLSYGIWLNPNIIHYDFDLDTAVAYLNTAGFSVELDSDLDGLSDNDETTIYNTDPDDPDSDDDGLLDGEEVNDYSTDPLNPDSDDDGYSDGEEVAAGTDPNDSGDFPITSTTPITTSLTVFMFIVGLTAISVISVVINVRRKKMIIYRKKHVARKSFKND